MSFSFQFDIKPKLGYITYCLERKRSWKSNDSDSSNIA